MGEKTTDRSFAGGEISPDMYGRVDLAKFQTGLATCRNAIVLPHGPVENRPGTEYVAAVKNSASPVRLIPFTYNFTQTMVIEVGAGYCRFHSQAGTLLAGTPAAWSNASSTITLPTTQATVTISSSGNAVITWDAHGLAAGTPVAFSTTGVLPTGITASTLYYVVSQTTNTFEIATSAGGTPVTVTAAGTGTQTCSATLPAVVAWTAHGLATGACISFATTGALPQGLLPATPYYVVSPTTNTFEISATQGGTAILVSGAQSGTQTAMVSYAPGGLVTYSGATYYCTAFSASTPPPSTSYWYAQPSSGVYEIPNGFAQADLMALHYVQSDDVLTIVHPNYPVSELRRYGATEWVLSLPAFTVPAYCPTNVAVAATTPHTTSWNPFPCQYAVTTVESSDYQESIASAPTASVSNDLTLVGNVNTITWTAPVGAAVSRYNVYKFTNGLWGYIGQAAAGTTSFVDNNIYPDTSQVPPIIDSGFNDQAGDYPGAVTYYQQRRWFAGSASAPQNVWATVSGTESNLTYTLPVQADNRLSFKIAAREASGISHLVPVANLLMLTPSNEWRVTSTDGNAVWAGNLLVQPQSSIGANNVQPIMVGNAVLFSQAKGCRIREMTYQWAAQAYLTNDISVMASHLFDYQNIYDMAFSKAPYPILWCVSSSGNLLGLTYVPEQQVAAWHHHDFGGVVESVAVITEQPAGTVASEDMLYLVVNRVINGATARYIERMHTRYFNTQSDGWFVDCGATNALPGTYAWEGSAIACEIPGHGLSPGSSGYFTFSDTALSGQYTVTSVVDENNLALTAPSVGLEVGTVSYTPEYQVSSVSGLTWLAGQTVNVLVDGAPIPARTVSAGGTVALDYPGTKVIVGLPITAQVQTLPPAFNIDPGYGEDRQKNVTQAWLRLYRSGGLYVGPSADMLTPLTQRAATDLPGNAPALVSGVLPIVVQPDWSFNGSVLVQQTDPLPFTICSICTDTAIR